MTIFNGVWHSFSRSTYGDLPPRKPRKPRWPILLGFQHFQPKGQLGVGLQGPPPPGEGPRVRGLSCHSWLSSYLCGPADLEQVEPVGVPVVDDVGQFPPLLLPAPRHGGQPFRRSALLNKTSRNVSPQEKKKPPHKPKVQVSCFIARTSYVSPLTDRPAVWSAPASRSRWASARPRSMCMCVFAFVNAQTINCFRTDTSDRWRCFS